AWRSAGSSKTRWAAQREAEWRQVLSQEVSAEDAHGRTRHYIRRSQLLQGMRSPALVLLFATSLVVPPARAQGAFSPVPALAVRPVPALQPGGRLGPR